MSEQQKLKLNGHANGHTVSDGDGVVTAVEESPRADHGSARHLRVRLCGVEAWCVEREGHDGPCVMVGKRAVSKPLPGPR